MGRFRVTNFAIAGLALLFAIPQAQAAKRRSERCQQIVLGLQRGIHHFFAPTKEWVLKHAKLGVERTYTSPILEGLMPDKNDLHPEKIKRFERRWDNFDRSRNAHREFTQALLSVNRDDGKRILSEEQAREILRFLKRGLGAKHVHMMIGFPSRGKHPDFNYELHFQTFSFAVTTVDGRKLFITPEQACIEVNQDPVYRDEIRAHWEPVESLVNAHGFFSVSRTGESGGGGTHVHLGWDSEENNLWLLRPDLFADFLEFPVQYPELEYLLHAHEDTGPHGSAPTFIQLPEQAITLMLELMLRLKSLHLTGATPREVQHFYAQKIDDALLEHNQYLSMKNMIQPNPRIEIRSHASFEGIDEIEAAVDLWLASLTWLNHDYRFQSPSQWQKRAPEMKGLDPLAMYDDLERLLRSLGLSASTRKTLYGINQIYPATQGFYHDVQLSPGSGLKVLRAASYPLSESPYSSLSIEISNPEYPKHVRAKVIYSDQSNLQSSHYGKLRLRLGLHYQRDTHGFVLIYEKGTDRLVDRFGFRSVPTGHGHLQLEIGINPATLIAEESFQSGFFHEGFLKIGNIGIGPNMIDFNPVDQLDRRQRRARQEEIFKIFAALPELLPMFLHGRGPSPSLARAIPEIHFENHDEAPVRFKAVYANGKRVEFQQLQRAHFSQVITEDLLKGLPDLQVIDGKLLVVLALIPEGDYDKDHLFYYLVEWDEPSRTMSVRKEGIYSDMDPVPYFFRIYGNMPETFGPEDRPDLMGDYFKAYFPEGYRNVVPADSPLRGKDAEP
ncbi:MAG TPA: hypothetical protein VM901_04465 [Bdellovibrionota bacterium]|jgi:hypothetical protein|nr:hypothetical protein [Bdellovibrionota bacterium]